MLSVEYCQWHEVIDEAITAFRNLAGIAADGGPQNYINVRRRWVICLVITGEGVLTCKRRPLVGVTYKHEFFKRLRFECPVIGVSSYCLTSCFDEADRLPSSSGFFSQHGFFLPFYSQFLHRLHFMLLQKVKGIKVWKLIGMFNASRWKLSINKEMMVGFYISPLVMAANIGVGYLVALKWCLVCACECVTMSVVLSFVLKIDNCWFFFFFLVKLTACCCIPYTLRVQSFQKPCRILPLTYLHLIFSLLSCCAFIPLHVIITSPT